MKKVWEACKRHYLPIAYLCSVTIITMWLHGGYGIPAWLGWLHLVSLTSSVGLRLLWGSPKQEEAQDTTKSAEVEPSGDEVAVINLANIWFLVAKGAGLGEKIDWLYAYHKDEMQAQPTIFTLPFAAAWLQERGCATQIFVSKEVDRRTQKKAARNLREATQLYSKVGHALFARLSPEEKAEMRMPIAVMIHKGSK